MAAKCDVAGDRSMAVARINLNSIELTQKMVVRGDDVRIVYTLTYAKGRRPAFIGGTGRNGGRVNILGTETLPITGASPLDK